MSGWIRAWSGKKPGRWHPAHRIGHVYRQGCRYPIVARELSAGDLMGGRSDANGITELVPVNAVERIDPRREAAK